MKTLKNSLIGAASGLAFLFSPAAMAETLQPAATDVAAVAAEAAPASGPALWKVADEDTTIYLFGTVHVLPDGTNWFTPAIDAALDSSAELVTELGPMEAIAAEFQQQLMAKGTLPAGETLRGLLNEEQKAAYEASMTGLGLPVEAFDRFEPWFATINLSILPLMQQGYRLDQGVEYVLEREAAQELERGALETVEFQLGVFDSGSTEDQITQMMAVIEGVDELKPFIDTMVSEWVSGDPEGLAEVMNESFAETPEFAERILYERNANWAVWIDERMDAPGTVFVAVGAGHLAGERSVQDLLTQRGITVTRVQ